TAVESVDDEILRKLDKGHTAADFEAVTRLCGALGLTLAPTFIPFTPWTTADGFRRLLDTIEALGLVENVAPVQWSLRLLISARSRLLELEDVGSLVGEFDRKALVYPWRHRDPAVDALAEQVSRIVRAGLAARRSRAELFSDVWEAAHGRPAPVDLRLLPRTVIPYMEEPWFC
ncbi:MAG TPA: CUAEP/CCAEP-tail radical SAM protein, partial [Bryobacteraceae bacterium]|nr:CUAEP/CCAEP-tail radical SAM protein [Bryobacteraceae bacterium]